jgi:NADH-quinone oxidoreductase subunit F
VLTTLRYFHDEYEAHIRDRTCPAKVCLALVTFGIDPDKCTGCGLCVKACDAGAIGGRSREAHRIDGSRCVRCGKCLTVCRSDAVRKG